MARHWWAARPGLCVVLAAAWAVPAAAAADVTAVRSRDQAIPSCYEQLAEFAPAGATRDLTVIIDQTTFTDARLRQVVQDTVTRLLRPGVRVSVAAFSAYAQGRYLDLLAAGLIEQPLAGRVRDSVPKRQLHQSDQCLDEQQTYARRLVARAIEMAFNGSDARIAQSDILAALRDLGRRVSQARISDPRGEGRAGADGHGEQRMVVLVSDMLENSAVSSFYQAARLRRIDPDEEIKKAAAAGLRPDFGGARIVVIGAGAVSERSADGTSYRDPRALFALEDFWRRWFAAGNATVIEFGKPMPLVDVGWKPLTDTDPR